MNIQDQVNTLEQGKRLAELGVTKDSCFFWIDRKEDSKLVYAKNIEFLETLPIFSAFTVGELGVMLPEYYESHQGPMENNWYCGHVECGDGDWFAFGDTEAQARANMLLHLLENKLITPSQCNERLTK